MLAHRMWNWPNIKPTDAIQLTVQWVTRWRRFELYHVMIHAESAQYDPLFHSQTIVIDQYLPLLCYVTFPETIIETFNFLSVVRQGDHHSTTRGGGGGGGLKFLNWTHFLFHFLSAKLYFSSKIFISLS